MLELAKREKKIGEYTHIALGKYKHPETIKEGIKLAKRKLWQ